MDELAFEKMQKILSPEQIDNFREYLQLKQITWFLKVARLRTSDTFGELALVNNDKRKATIKCLSDCVFATIDKNDYQTVLRNLQLRNF